ncbi:uncharacterized protein BX664DRAFT_318637 [Halteromyces radiatus]|uniref:uncharacterized protein n=1 Tax=Halteromyces radiatus TaxID=101107 RepID=UPI002220DE6B|nr:uncharacterized protein BX664DRAFT_318637 [Halteromyces radiatus]KAI8076304.1 hypothetical protein BX664DRAFT_318637 [Halteromyces radiatus]
MVKKNLKVDPCQFGIEDKVMIYNYQSFERKPWSKTYVQLDWIIQTGSIDGFVTATGRIGPTLSLLIPVRVRGGDVGTKFCYCNKNNKNGPLFMAWLGMIEYLTYALLPLPLLAYSRILSVFKDGSQADVNSLEHVQKIMEEIKNYPAERIYNMDESGLFHFNNERSPSGIKVEKARITIVSETMLMDRINFYLRFCWTYNI